MALNAPLPPSSGDVALGPDPRRYRTGQSLMAHARALARADTATLVALTGAGVPAALARELGRALDIAPRHFFKDILGTNRSAAEKKATTHEALPAAPGLAALALLRLLACVETLPGHQGPRFDAARWLGSWIEQPHPGLDGRPPAALLRAPEGVAVLVQLLGAPGGGGSGSE